MRTGVSHYHVTPLAPRHLERCPAGSSPAQTGGRGRWTGEWALPGGAGWARLWAGVLSLPRLIQAGLLVGGLGALGDLLYHALPEAQALRMEVLVGPDAYWSHLATFVGMLAIVAGVVRMGVRRGYGGSGIPRSGGGSPSTHSPPSYGGFHRAVR